MNEPRKYVLEFPSYYKPKIRDHPLYGLWAMMVTRCENPKFPKYKDYGGRGIKVCRRWRKGDGINCGFVCFVKDMGNRPSLKHSLDRKDNDGNYEPKNCRWATNTEQANNRRSNHLIKINGENVSMMVAAKMFGVSYHVLQNRLNRGWSVNQSLMVPSGFRYKDPKTAIGSQLPQTKLTINQVLEIREQHKQKIPQCEIAKKFGVSRANVCLIVNGRSWKHVK